jgi:catechol 2,3-dioxygenase
MRFNMTSRSTGATDTAAPVPALPDEYGIRPSGYRLPAATRLGRVRLAVSQVERSIRYYRDVLGLRELERSSGRAVLGSQDNRPIVELEEQSRVQPVPRSGRLGLYHFAILLPDRASLGRFVGHLAEVSAQAGMSDHYVSEAVYLRDPDGLGIEVYADRPRSQWRRSGRELSMSTVPLDVDSLVAAAHGERWTGMPSGTTLGHVHLHVGGLEQARAFYHVGLGFDLIVWSYPSALFMSAGGYHHHLGTNTWAEGAPSAGAQDARLLDWEILVPDASDLSEAVDSLRRGGHDVVVADGAATARDPWGTAVRLRAG